MSVKDLAKAIGRTGLYHVGTLKFDVKVMDVRQVFGRIDFLVTPEHGNGQQWVESSRVQLDEAAQ
jgi:hypothetical protein